MKNIFFWSICLSLFSLSACNNNGTTTTQPNKEKLAISQINYYLRYMVAKLEVEAKATFKSDSTSIEIPGGVTLNHEPMRIAKLPKIGQQYRFLDDRVPLEKRYIFRYKDTDGTKYADTIGLAEFNDFKIGSEISQRKGGLLIWEGAVLDKMDAMTFILTDSKGKTLTINHVGTSQGTKIPIQANHLAGFALGEVTLIANRKRTVIYARNNAPIRLVMEYYLKPITFELKE
ncbi:MAG: hypothetical protein GY810_17025 [Aureispira sp.]|nr:hypothetical protein [Aureispira sp.]